MYSVRVYKHTGFNAVNIPDSPSLLDRCAYVDLPPIDTIQDGLLSEISVRCSFADVEDADYCRVGDYYYACIPTMTSADVATLTLSTDYLNAAGGVSSIEILDGVTRRVKPTTDGFGEWATDDPYLAPAEPLVLDYQEIKMADAGTGHRLIESTLELGLMSVALDGETYDDGNGETVTVPKVYPPGGTGTVYKGEGMGTGTPLGTVLFPLTPVIPATEDSVNPIREGLQMCRALGVENAITDCVEIPAAYVTITGSTSSVTESGGRYSYNYISGQSQQSVPLKSASGTRSWSVVKEIEGKVIEKDTGYAYEYATVKNRRLLYGRQTPVGILTNAGNRLEAAPEETFATGETTLKFKAFGDPHAGGCPYFSFKHQNGNTVSGLFWTNCVKGLPWKKIPLVFRSKSGSALDRQSFQASREIASMEHAQELSSLKNQGLNAAIPLWEEKFGESATQAGLATSDTLLRRGLMRQIGGDTSRRTMDMLSYGAISSPWRILAGSAVGKRARDEAIWNAQRAEEKRQYLVSQSVYSPTISISYDCEPVRDFSGDMVYAYRYRYSANDLARLDKILTMYGYAVSLPVTKSMLTAHRYFDYIDAQVSVKGTAAHPLPKYIADGIAAQISGGVRIWHTLPDPAHYNDNPLA